jgi:hypothetical protein
MVSSLSVTESVNFKSQWNMSTKAAARFVKAVQDSTVLKKNMKNQPDR